MNWGFLQGKECQKQAKNNKTTSAIKKIFREYLQTQQIDIEKSHIIAVSQDNQSWLTAINEKSLLELGDNIYIGVFKINTLIKYYKIPKNSFVKHIKNCANKTNNGRYLIDEKLLKQGEFQQCIQI